MNRLTSTFLLLLGVATLASGALWKRLEALLTGQGTAPDIVLAIGSVAGAGPGRFGPHRGLYGEDSARSNRC